MVFGFEFKSPNLIYYESGSKTKEEAKSKLEEISRGHCEEDSLAIGTVYCLDDGEFDMLEKYEIELKDGEIILEALKLE